MRVLDAPRKLESFYAFKKNHSAFAPKDKTTEVCINLYWNPLCTIAKHMGHMMHRVSVRPLSWGVENRVSEPLLLVRHTKFSTCTRAGESGKWFIETAYNQLVVLWSIPALMVLRT